MERDTRSGQVRTGLFVLVALAILLVASLSIAGGGPFAGSRVPYTVRMDDAGGVQAGDPVRLAGVEVGRIDTVVLRDDAHWPVALAIEVDRGLELRQGASASLSSDGLLGTPFLALERGPAGANPLEPRAVIDGVGSTGIEAALGDLSQLARKASGLVDDAGALFEGLGPRLERLLDRGEAVLAEENLAEVRETLRVARGAVERLEPRLARLGEQLEEFADEAGVAMAPVPELLAEAQGLAQDLRTALGDDGERLSTVLDSARETLGTADAALGTVADQRDDITATLEALKRAAANLEALSASLKQRPDRLLRPSRREDRRPGDSER